MRKVLVFCCLLCLFSWKEKKPRFKHMSDGFVEKCLDLVIETKGDDLIEFPHIYDSLATDIPWPSNDTVLLEGMLQERGFKMINYGWGPFPGGPRLVSRAMQKGDCICEVAKLYKDTQVDGYYEMAESISCMDSMTHEKTRKFHNEPKK
jgi:hypothetical protein